MSAASATSGNGAAAAAGSASQSLELTVQEQELISELVKRTNKQSEEGGYKIDAAVAQKFLMARKFHLLRAEELLINQQRMYGNMRLLNVDPNDQHVHGELLSGKFIVPGTRDSENGAIIIFRAERHIPRKEMLNATLRSIVYILNTVTDNLATQRQGVTFIYSMNNAGWANMDFGMTRALLEVLQNAFPGRLRHAWILNAPFWLRATVKAIFPLIGAKISARVQFVNSLEGLVPLECLPPTVGGTMAFDDNKQRETMAALIGAFESTHARVTVGQQRQPLKRTAESDNTPDNVPDKKPAAAAVKVAAAAAPVEEEGEDEGEDAPPPIPPRSAPKPSPTQLTLEEWESRYSSMVQSGEIMKQFMVIDAAPIGNTFKAAQEPDNQQRNRYTNVLAFDQTRVYLKDDEDSDYINANYVDGYKHPRAFIATQGPLPNTFEHFWSMVWHEKATIIVMATREIEKGRMKCHRYWPEPESTTTYGDSTVTGLGETEDEGYVIRKFEMTYRGSKPRPIVQYQFIGWPDHGIPSSSYPVVKMLDEVNALRTSDPVVVHCSAGIGRTGTFITVDTCVKQLRDVKSADVALTMRNLRCQRYGSIQTPEQYRFCYQAIMEASESLA